MGVGDRVAVQLIPNRFRFFCHGCLVAVYCFLFDRIGQWFPILIFQQVIPAPIPDLSFNSADFFCVILCENNSIFHLRSFIKVDRDAVRADAVLIVCIVPDLAYFNRLGSRIMPVDELGMGTAGI